MEILENKKIEIIEQIGEDGIRKLKFSKILKLLQSEIEELMNYWTVKQIHKMVNEVFNLHISASFFYKFCQKKNFKVEKKDKQKEVGASQKRDSKISSLEDLIGK